MIDSPLGTCTLSHEIGGAFACRGGITESIYKMDGPHFGSQDGRITVIGATDIPFNSDDVVLRRLPGRLPINL